ncbi:OsmC family protein [Thiomicrospira sp. ALE5]|uniref:OsmC family protein n=1 Tax=Thiomicrospira sp. ALE5 TaxID=748650 RepID=UPI0008E5162C|nr:OsmC family protein [Thiomicrospira sp. ALE5]SFR64364.1 putative redox protein [Thiomicrospira sp. ALE5]
MNKIATVKWVDGMSFVGETASGHAVVMDGPPDIGGKNLGPRPMEMVLLGLGGCTAVDVMMILQKGGQAVRDCRIEVSAERAETIPKVYTKIHLHYVVTGSGLQDKKVARAVNLSAEKYCSVSKMLEQAAELTHDFELVDDAE